jgi:CHAT domain-containing protein
VRLGEKYQFSLMTSTRGIVLKNRDTYKKDQMALLMGGITYDYDSTAYYKANVGHYAVMQKNHLKKRSGQPGSSYWETLPETGFETEIIEKLFAKNGVSVKNLGGLEASEEAFYKYVNEKSSPRFIHLATHGFFAEKFRPDTLAANMESASIAGAIYNSENTLMRSGIILSGANQSFSAQETTSRQQDGILTAYEITQTKLHQTELVVLSACETGLGDIKGSEGVYGLQRAFKIAGAKNVVMSLWQVPDAATRNLMELFYNYYLVKHLSIRESFYRAVNDVKRKDDNPYLWAGFVLVE